MGDLGSYADSLPSRIAALVHNHFDGLPKRSKPNIRDDGTAEWIPMTGIVLVKGENTPSEKLTCITVTTGAKCLPAGQIPLCKGLVLHDSHAEILAMRAFNFWLLSECQGYLAREKQEQEHAQAQAQAQSESTSSNNADGSGNKGEEDSVSPYIRRRKHGQHESPYENENENENEGKKAEPPFELHPGLKIYMYCTCAPCGDASMELVMAAQDDPTPWEIPVPTSTTPTSASASVQFPPPTTPALHLPGRANFSNLGSVRRKPARADAESTKSKSCSDKLSLRQVSSLLSYETSLFVAVTANVYISGVVLPEEEVCAVGVERCFGGNGRMKILNGRRWGNGGGGGGGDYEAGGEDPGKVERQEEGYTFHPFKIHTIPNKTLKALWPFRKPRPSDPIPEGASFKRPKPGNLSAIWIRAPSAQPAEPTLASTDNGSKTLPVLRGSKTGLFENIINGVRQGHKVASPGVKGASALSRAKMWRLCREVIVANDLLEGENGGSARDEGVNTHHKGASMMSGVLQAETYKKFKKDPVVATAGLRARNDAIQSTKETLKGWVPNSGDEDWGLDVLVDSRKRKR
ncbi:adenosine deaminase/editase [Aspergillus crustosus]